MSKRLTDRQILRRHHVTLARLADTIRRHEAYLRLRVRNLRADNQPADADFRDGEPWASWQADCPFCGKAGALWVDALTGHWYCTGGESYEGCHREGRSLFRLEETLIEGGYLPLIPNPWRIKGRRDPDEVGRWVDHLDSIMDVIGGPRDSEPFAPGPEDE